MHPSPYVSQKGGGRVLSLPFGDLFRLAAHSLLQALFEPFFYLVVFMVYWQCRTLAEQQKSMFGRDNFPLLHATVEFTVKGMLGGIFASMLILSTGLTINDLGLVYLWPLAILLLLINARFLCFAYAGGLLALSNIIFGWPYLSVAHLLGLVAILHVTEAFLVLSGGKFASLPAYFYHKGQAVGGFSLTNFWPLPLMMAFAMSLPEAEVASMLKMPDWYPLFPVAQPPAGQISVLAPVPVIAALGYGSVALSRPPEAKRRISALLLFCYSLCLFIAAWLTTVYPWWGAVAAVLSFAGHEGLVYLDRRLEFQKAPIYTIEPGLFIVLDTIWQMPAQRAGVQRGDIITQVNGWEIRDEYDLADATRFLADSFTLKILRKGKEIDVTGCFVPAEEKVLGILRMPVMGRDVLLTMHSDYSLLKKGWRRLRKKGKASEG